MTDTDKLKRLAEAAIKAGCKDWPMVHYYDAATPSAILALIAENERLVDQYRTAMDRAEELGFAAEGLKQQRDEAVALLTSLVSERRAGIDALRNLTGEQVTAFLARIDAAE